MELRDQFAIAALQGLLAGDIDGYEEAGQRYWTQGGLNAESLAKDAYFVADAMMKVREEKA